MFFFGQNSALQAAVPFIRLLHLGFRIECFVQVFAGAQAVVRCFEVMFIKLQRSRIWFVFFFHLRVSRWASFFCFLHVFCVLFSYSCTTGAWEILSLFFVFEPIRIIIGEYHCLCSNHGCIYVCQVPGIYVKHIRLGVTGARRSSSPLSGSGL